MVASKARIKYKAAANAAHDRYTATQPAPFLRRNLRVILDEHEQALTRIKNLTGNTEEPKDPLSGCVHVAKARTQLDHWNATDNTDMWNFMTKFDRNASQNLNLQEPRARDSTSRTSNDSAPTVSTGTGIASSCHPRSVLVIERLALRLNEHSSESSDHQFGNNVFPNWIRRDAQNSSVVSCSATVLEDIDGVAGNPLALATALGSLSIYHGVLHITFRKPFEIPLPNRARGRQASLDSRQQMFPATWLKLKIRNASHRFASHVSSLRMDRVPATTTEEDHVVITDKMRLSNLRPQIAKHTSKIWELDASSQTKILLTPKLDINFKWMTRPQETPLSAFNRATEHLYEERPLQLPTPNASEDLDHENETFRVTYLFLQNRRHVRNDLFCPLCQKDLSFTAFSRLHFHLRTCHDNFSFVVNNDSASTSSSTTAKIVIIEVAPEIPGRANGLQKDDVMLNWVAPPRPFDLDSYLAGTSHWGGEPMTRRGRGRPPKNGRRTVRPPPPVPTPVAPRLAPEAVPELTARLFTAHPVPEVIMEDGRKIRFYRTSSKKPLRTGEHVTESDEDVDDSWIRTSERQRVRHLKVLRDGKSQPLAPAEQEFVLEWNAHVNRELKLGKNGDRLTREGVIRFARHFRYKLEVPEWKAQFAAKLQRMLTYRLCDQRDVAYCLTPQDPTVNDDAQAGATDEQMDIDTTNGDGHAEVQEASVWSICTCGNRVYGIRGVVRCSNLKCPRETFHMQCHDLKDRPEGWLCPTCRTAQGD